MKTDKGKSHVDVEAAVTCVRKLPRIIFQRVAFAYKYNLLISLGSSSLSLKFFATH
jgi:hypothetical protein